VIIGLVHGLTLTLLIGASMALGAIAAMSRPVFLSSLPTLVPGKLREANGLFDSSVRIAQAGARARNTTPLACCSSLLTGTKRMVGRWAASQIASASVSSFFCRFTKGFT
jgi:hypothetical protein